MSHRRVLPIDWRDTNMGRRWPSPRPRGVRQARRTLQSYWGDCSECQESGRPHRAGVCRWLADRVPSGYGPPHPMARSAALRRSMPVAKAQSGDRFLIAARHARDSLRELVMEEVVVVKVDEAVGDGESGQLFVQALLASQRCSSLLDRPKARP